MELGIEAPATSHGSVITSVGRLYVRCREFQQSAEFDDTLKRPSQPRASA